MPEKREFLGNGVKFPPQVNKATGRFMMSDGLQSVKESVYTILMTQKTERILHPDFGCGLLSYTFMDTNLTSLNLMSREIANNIRKAEPRISDVSVNIDPNTKPGCLIVNIEYKVIELNVRDNLVFPFYLNTGEENEEINAGGDMDGID